MGIDDAEAKAELGAKTRERKQKDLTFPELQDAWRGRMSAQESADALATLEGKARRRCRTGGRKRRGPGDRVCDQSTSLNASRWCRSGSCWRRRLWHSVGQATVEQVKREAERSRSDHRRPQRTADGDDAGSARRRTPRDRIRPRGAGDLQALCQSP